MAQPGAAGGPELRAFPAGGGVLDGGRGDRVPLRAQIRDRRGHRVPEGAPRDPFDPRYGPGASGVLRVVRVRALSPMPTSAGSWT